MKPSAPEPDVSKKGIRIFFAVAFYFSTSVSLVFLNKFVLSGYDFEYPLFITWWQIIVAIFCCWITGLLGNRVPGLEFFPPMEFDLAVSQRVAPLTLAFVGMIAFNNLCLQYVEVSFYQVARSLTICFSIFFTWTILGVGTSKLAMAASAMVMLGFVIGSVSEVRFSLKGVVFGVLSSVFVSLNGIYVKKTLKDVLEDNQWRLMIYNNVLSAFMMIPLIVVSGEAHQLIENPKTFQGETWMYLTLTGLFGYLINIATYMQINYTSALTHSISGTLKACLQTLIAIWYYSNPVSTWNAFGIFLTIAGSFWYSYVRYQEMSVKK